MITEKVEKNTQIRHALTDTNTHKEHTIFRLFICSLKSAKLGLNIKLKRCVCVCFHTQERKELFSFIRWTLKTYSEIFIMNLKNVQFN